MYYWFAFFICAATLLLVTWTNKIKLFSLSQKRKTFSKNMSRCLAIIFWARSKIRRPHIPKYVGVHKQISNRISQLSCASKWCIQPVAPGVWVPEWHSRWWNACWNLSPEMTLQMMKCVLDFESPDDEMRAGLWVSWWWNACWTLSPEMALQMMKWVLEFECRNGSPKHKCVLYLESRTDSAGCIWSTEIENLRSKSLMNFWFMGKKYPRPEWIFLSHKSKVH